MKKAKHRTLQYAEKLGWNTTGLPDHGVILDVLWRIITAADRRGMLILRWRFDFFEAGYGVFTAKPSDRCRTKHVFWPCFTDTRSGVTTRSETCRDLMAYADRLENLTGSEWAEVRRIAAGGNAA